MSVHAAFEGVVRAEELARVKKEKTAGEILVAASEKSLLQKWVNSVVEWLAAAAAGVEPMYNRFKSFPLPVVPFCPDHYSAVDPLIKGLMERGYIVSLSTNKMLVGW